METPISLSVAVAVCLGISFLLSGMEAGVFALSRLRVRQLMRSGQPRAAMLHGFLEHPENFLWTILVGNTVVNFVAVALLVTRLHEWLAWHRGLFVAGLLALVVLLYTLCDLLPKVLFLQYPNRLCLLAARPFRLIHLALAPLVALAERLATWMLRWTGGRAFSGRLFGNREELRQVMQDSAAVLSSEERAMINRVLDLQNLTVRNLAQPLEEAGAVTAQTPMREVLQLCRERGQDSVPVWQPHGGGRRIAGLIALRPVIYRGDLDPERPAGDYVRPALYLEDTVRVETALQRLRRGGQRVAIVLDQERREQGIITLRDIMRFIFGETSR